jgi:putative FmdB family regulatory protein
MPTYEYGCSSCNHEWEFEQSIKDAPITECPACHQQAAKRQISRGTGFILKGGGWYSDLYSSPSNSKPAAEKPSGDATAPKTESAQPTSGTTPDTSGGSGTSSKSSTAAAA